MFAACSETFQEALEPVRSLPTAKEQPKISAEFNAYEIEKTRFSATFSPTRFEQGNLVGPSWLSTNIKWWNKGILSDPEFTKGVQFLINQGIITN